jgi:DNA polymerase
MALRLTERKDPEGKLLIHLLCKPQKDGSWAEDPDPLEYLWDYCAQDVVTERAVSQALIPLIDDEQRLWEADCRMNERGFSLDARFAREALSLVDEEKAELNAELYELTLHHVERGTQRARFIKWADYMGVHLSNTKKETVTELLESGDRLPKAVRRGLEILRTVNMTSVTKFKTALVSVCDDGRLRDTQMFHGANTGRWTGKGIQPHNLPRGVSPVGCEEMALDASLDLEDFRLLHGSPTEKLSAAIRGLFVASKGLHLFVADYSAIEARVLCWLAGQEDAVELFRRGDDVYMDMAASVYACELRDVDSDKRFVGKQAVLGLGYGMGATKFSDNVRMLGLRFGFKADMPLGFYKSVVDVYRREKYQQVAEFWGVLERAAIAAVREGGMHLAGDKLALAMRGRFLRIRLPSGRMLSYAEPMLALRTLWYFSAVNSEQEKVSLPVRTKRGEAVPWVRAKKTAEERGWTLLRDEPSDRDGEELTYMTARGMGAWIREGTYGGKLAENVTQAVARDVLAGAILRADADYEFHKVLLTVHDEIICEAPPNTNIARFARLVGEPPEWAPDLPVDVEPWHGPRYGKA